MLYQVKILFNKLTLTSNNSDNDIEEMCKEIEVMKTT